MRRAPEFAFEIAAHDCTWLRNRLESLGASCLGSRQSRSLYLDTPDGAIAKLGFGLCLQRQDKVGLSQPARRTPVSSRARWIRVIEDLSPAPRGREELDECLQKDAVREGLELLVSRSSLETLFAWEFADAGLEICLDRSIMASAGQEFILATARLRQLSGSPIDFLRGVREIADPVKLRLCVEPIAVRARRRLQSGKLRPVGAYAPRLGRAMDQQQVFQTIAQACFNQYLFNEISVRDGRDVEAVHQCRVAFRRLRTALRLFRLKAGDAREAAWRHELKDFSALLRDARDLDVLLAERLQPLVSTSGAAAALVNEIKFRRESAYDRLVEALQGERASRFYLELMLWIAACDVGATDESRQTPVAFLQKRLSKLTENLIERGEKLETDSEDERHQTRIAAKNLRYSAEFFESLLTGKVARKRFKGFIEALKEIQEVLGVHNDQIVACRYFATLAQDLRNQDLGAKDPNGRAELIDKALALAEPAAIMPQDEFLRLARRAFRSLKEAKPFWAKLLDTAKGHSSNGPGSMGPGSTGPGAKGLGVKGFARSAAATE